jgi:hypothetical protein
MVVGTGGASDMQACAPTRNILGCLNYDMQLIDEIDFAPLFFHLLVILQTILRADDGCFSRIRSFLFGRF